jgi:hypothetical protein
LTSKSPYLSRGASRLSLGRLAAGIRAVHVLTTHTSYHDLGGDYFIVRDNPEHRRRRALLQLERLGYRVTLEPVVT